MAFTPAPFEAFQFHMQLPNGGLFEGHVGKLPMPGRPVKHDPALAPGDMFGPHRPNPPMPKPIPKPPVQPRPGGILPPLPSKRGARRV